MDANTIIPLHPQQYEDWKENGMLKELTDAGVIDKVAEQKEKIIAENSLAKESENPPKTLTRQEYKKAMRTFFTQRHATVTPCGHKFHPTAEPKNNCQYCWIAFFQNQGQITKIADECFRNEGEAVLTKIKGKKFTKNFKKFMAALCLLLEEQKNETNT
jgi:hypothetical protein